MSAENILPPYWQVTTGLLPVFYSSIRRFIRRQINGKNRKCLLKKK
jgi:hypothetical protein